MTADLLTNLADKHVIEQRATPLATSLEDRLLAFGRELLRSERERQIGYLSKLCWTAKDISYALKWGVDESEHEDIDQQIADSKWPIVPAHELLAGEGK
jgi:hypothetical protein